MGYSIHSYALNADELIYRGAIFETLNDNSIPYNFATHEAISQVPAADAVPMDFHERCLSIEIQKRMEVERNLNDCRNELCLKCGDYRMRHKGACDGCKWKWDNNG